MAVEVWPGRPLVVCARALAVSSEAENDFDLSRLLLAES